MGIHIWKNQSMRLGLFSVVSGLVVFAALPGVAEQRGLGESLLLEGRMALQRGEAWLLSEQLPDGSWRENLALTAQAGIVLANADAEFYAAPLKRAARWIMDNQHPPASAGQIAQALRLPLRLQLDKIPQWLAGIRTENPFRNPAGEPAVDRQWLLEAHFLLPPETVLLSVVEVAQLQQLFLLEKESQPAFALLTLLSKAGTGVPVSELDDLCSACVAQAAVALPEQLFWLIRALKASERFCSGNAKNWRAVVVARILARQRANGAFSATMQPSSAEDLLTSVFYLQGLQLCLAP